MPQVCSTVQEPGGPGRALVTTGVAEAFSVPAGVSRQRLSPPSHTAVLPGLPLSSPVPACPHHPPGHPLLRLPVCPCSMPLVITHPVAVLSSPLLLWLLLLAPPSPSLTPLLPRPPSASARLPSTCPPFLRHSPHSPPCLPCLLSRLTSTCPFSAKQRHCAALHGRPTAACFSAPPPADSSSYGGLRRRHYQALRGPRRWPPYRF